MYCKLNRNKYLLNLPAIHIFLKKNKWIWCYINKTEANLASTKVLAARCVRVIHAQCVLQFALLSRTLLRSSSNNEPSDPPYRIIFFYYSVYIEDSIHIQWQNNNDLLKMERFKTNQHHHHKNNDDDLFIHIMVRHKHYRKYNDCAKLKVVYLILIMKNQIKKR